MRRSRPRGSNRAIGCPGRAARVRRQPHHLPPSPSPSSHRTEVLRYLYWVFWFFLVPAAAAYGLILWLSASELAGPLDEAARDQSVPAGIVAFTLFEAALWYFRHRLPFSAPLLGRTDLQPEERKHFEAGAQLLDDADRLVEQHRRDLARKRGDAALEELRVALDELRQAMKADPFDRARF